jgi:hypothetical protein
MGQASAGLPEGRRQTGKQILRQRVFDVKEMEEEADREDEYKQGASIMPLGERTSTPKVSPTGADWRVPNRSVEALISAPGR